MDISIEDKFNRLVEQWRNETGGYSLYIQKYTHPLYREIIDMGDEIIPLLLEDSKQNPKDWKYALQQLTPQEF